MRWAGCLTRGFSSGHHGRTPRATQLRVHICACVSTCRRPPPGNRQPGLFCFALLCFAWCSRPWVPYISQEKLLGVGQGAVPGLGMDQMHNGSPGTQGRAMGLAVRLGDLGHLLPCFPARLVPPGQACVSPLLSSTQQASRKSGAILQWLHQVPGQDRWQTPTLTLSLTSCLPAVKSPLTRKCLPTAMELPAPPPLQIRAPGCCRFL